VETPYRAVNFVKHDIITKDEMDQLQTNYQWINDNTPRSRLYFTTSSQPDMMVIIAGKKEIKANKKTDNALVKVGFGKAFAPTCRPNVTTAVNADFQTNIFCVVHGPKGINLPNSTGFEISISIAADKKKNDVIKKPFFVHWSAIGFRENDMNEF
jgi:hypothetical protein